MNSKGIFITGTDTEIGKTHVSRLLADALARDRRVTYLKPVQTGCEEDGEGSLIAPDVEHVLAGRAIRCETYDDHVPYRFAPACSPHLAARMAGVTIDPARIREAFAALRRRADTVLVEGAGGIHVPLREDYYTLDLVADLGLPAVVVTTPRLGTLNHTLLTVSALRRRGIAVAGIVMNNHANRRRDFIFEDNVRTIAAFVAPVPMVETGYGQGENESIREFCHAIRHRL